MAPDAAAVETAALVAEPTVVQGGSQVEQRQTEAKLKKKVVVAAQPVYRVQAAPAATYYMPLVAYPGSPAFR